MKKDIKNLEKIFNKAKYEIENYQATCLFCGKDIEGDNEIIMTDKGFEHCHKKCWIKFKKLSTLQKSKNLIV